MVLIELCLGSNDRSRLLVAFFLCFFVCYVLKTHYRTFLIDTYVSIYGNVNRHTVAVQYIWASVQTIQTYVLIYLAFFFFFTATFLFLDNRVTFMVKIKL